MNRKERAEDAVKTVCKYRPRHSEHWSEVVTWLMEGGRHDYAMRKAALQYTCWGDLPHDLEPLESHARLFIELRDKCLQRERGVKGMAGKIKLAMRKLFRHSE